ncbi:MAG: hypothetical protein WA405_13110 [Candidatus Acidiferrales bacterium]
MGEWPIGPSPEDIGVPMVRGSYIKERGGSKINFLITLVILGSIIFACVRIVPAYFANYQLQDAMKSEAQFAAAAYPRRTEDSVRGDIWNKVQELGIPADENDIAVEMSNGKVDITLDYTVSFDLIVTQWNHEFHTHADNHSI